MRRPLLLLAVAGLGLLAWREASALVSEEGDTSAGFDPLGIVFSAVYSAEAALMPGGLMLSDAGRAAIARHEGLRLDPYLDEAGHWTVGYGHKLGPLESRDPITHARALELLQEDTESAVNAVNSLVNVPLSQQQFDALVSLAFNIGNGAFRESTLLRLLNDGDYGGAAAQFAVWNKVTRNGVKVVSPILVTRRAREAELFASGIA